MSLFKYLLTTALFLSCCSIALEAATQEEEAVTIDSELADYNGEKIILQGNVVIEHMLGTISANNITLHTSKKKEIGPFGLLQMHDCVKMVFKDGEQLSCGKAELDFQDLTGNFSGNDNQEYVTYIENNVIKREDSSLIPLTVKSRCMSIRLASKNLKDEKKLPKNNVSVLTADEQVTVNYNNDFTALADHAIYQRIPDIVDVTKAVALPGVLTMTAAQNGGTCQVSNKEGDVVNAILIAIDTVKRQLTFTNPKGTLKGSDTSKNIGRVDFSAQMLVWDDRAGVLTLSNQVEVIQQGMGKLETPHEVRFYQRLINQKKSLKAVETLGDTVLTYRQKDKNLSHVLTCSGPVRVDHEKMETRLLAIQDDSGQVAEKQQVHFEDAKGEIFADKVLIRYALINNSIVVNKIFLVGNVKIYNRLNSEDDETVVVLQYVLADRVDFTPSTKEMLFKSSPEGRRVLFFDKANNLQVSAPALQIIRDKATGKESIKGAGDVRFSFLESEFEQLRKRFSLYLNSPKNEEASSKTIGDL